MQNIKSLSLYRRHSCIEYKCHFCENRIILKVNRCLNSDIVYMLQWVIKDENGFVQRRLSEKKKHIHLLFPFYNTCKQRHFEMRLQFNFKVDINQQKLS